jgi:hypothetical protein
MKKLLYILIIALLATPVMAASLRQHQVQFVDEFGDPVTTITSITIFNSGLGTSPTIYNDRAGTLTVTNPITPSSTNSTFDQSIGLVRWFQQKPTYKITATDGSKTLTIDGQDEGDTRFPWYDNYIGTAASLSVGDNESITVGTDSDMVLSWNNGSGFLSWVPAADGSAFNLGTSGTANNVDFNWFVGTGLGIKANEGTATLVIDGVTTSINASSNFAVNICTGTSTGATSIGNSAGGAVSVDTDTGITVNADDSYALTVSAGTIGIAATGGDVTIDATDKSVIVRGTEAIADAITIDADAGGIDISTAATFDIDVTATGGKILMNATENAAGAISMTVNGGSSETILITNTQGTASTAISLVGTVGGISLVADGAAAGDITLDSEDDLILTSTGKVTITNTEVVTISGGATITGVTTIVSSLITPSEILVATNNIEITQSGTVFILNHATEFASTLPTVASSAGVTFRFIVGVAPDTGSFTILTDSLEDKLQGVVTVDGASIGCVAQDTITFTASAALVGDWIELTSDGVFWYLSGAGDAATAIVPSGT